MHSFANTPEPPYFAVIFTSRRTGIELAAYAQMAERMLALAAQQPGFLGVESVRDASGVGITVSYWENQEAVDSWRRHAEHRVAQQLGRTRWYDGFRLRICRVERESAFESRDQCPEENKAAMDKDQLNATLKQLHAELSAEERVDPQTLQLLQTLTEDIQRLAQRSDEPTPDDKQPVSKGLKDLLLKFEAEHPQLTATLGQVADGLSRMGI